MTTLSSADKQQLESLGISAQQVENQIVQFKNGFAFSDLIAPATIGKGIVRFNENEIKDLVRQFDEDKKYYDIIKFVPASGAASRMFKDLYAMKPEAVETFIKGIHNFAFFNDLKCQLQAKGKDIEKMLENKEYQEIIDTLLNADGMNYGNLPKALLKFHKYGDSARLAMEEHLVEAAEYSNNGEVAKLHFTMSQEHLDIFKKIVNYVLPKYEKQFDIKYEIGFSVQKPSTDTIAVDMNNEPFRDKDGKLVFRPGGHGALIQNLNDLHKEIIFIKNIDNVVPDRFKATTYEYKKVLGGYLFRLQQQQFEYLEMLDDGNVTNEELAEITAFAKDKLMIDIPDFFSTYNEIEKIDFLYGKLNRPMRVCGMVKNEGEPGGGPYFTRNSSDEISLQIVESSQIDHKNEKQEAMFRSSTHFNPVDLICATQDFKGNSFNLPDYVDPETGFISLKSKDGKDLKAMELPGLWNGAMADWITIFVEVPILTFNPVKTVNDLLRETHQG